VLVNSTGTGTIGRVGHFTNSPDDKPCVADGHVTVVRPKADLLDSRFCFYWLNSQPFSEHLHSALVVGATNQIELNRDRLRDAQVPLPSLRIQRQIADHLDGEIARLNLLDSHTEGQVALMREHLSEFVRASVTGEGERSTVDTGIPWMPRISQSRQLLKISHHFLTGSGTTPPSDRLEYYDGKQPWVTSTDVKDQVITATSRHITERALSDISTLTVHPVGSLVVAMYGAGKTKGRVGILDIDASVNQACCVLTPIGRITSEYAYHWFKSHKQGVIQLANGAGQPNLSQDLIRSLRIPTPEIDVQRLVVRQAREAESHFSHLSAALTLRRRLLAERRRSLITTAVIGRIDVGSVQEPAFDGK
jgi:type I restriction enzyme S subunit